MLCAVSPTRAEFAIFIDQEYRNQGIGTKFTEVTLEFAREKGYRRIWLSVEVEQPDVPSAVYKKLGFRMRDLFGPEQEMEICFDKQGIVGIRRTSRRPVSEEMGHVIEGSR